MHSFRIRMCSVRTRRWIGSCGSVFLQRTRRVLFSIGVNRLWRCLRIKYIAPVSDPFSQTPSRPASLSRAWLWKTTSIQTDRRIEIRGQGKRETLIHNPLIVQTYTDCIRAGIEFTWLTEVPVYRYLWLNIPTQKEPENTPERTVFSVFLSPITLSRALCQTRNILLMLREVLEKTYTWRIFQIAASRTIAIDESLRRYASHRF